MGLFGRRKKQADKPTEPVKPKEVVEEVKEKLGASEEKVENDKAASAARYHVSQNKDEKSDHYKEWRIRKEGSDKTIKYFKTQREAIDYAEDLAKRQGSSVVIHKVDGTLRKQDYSKK
ncbi:MAG: DUF2188 domain-containing protein [Acholeplasmataceae bacterium]